MQAILKYFPRGQFVRYLCVGVFNTVFGYGTFALTLFLLSRAAPQHYLYLIVVAASIISTPLNITVAYLGYKFFVFRTRGNYLSEWIRAFGVYGVGMLPGLLALSGLTKLIQSLLQSHQASWQALLALCAVYLHGHASGLLQKLSTPKALAGYIAGAMLQCVTIMLGFIGHQRITFRRKAAV